MIKKIIFALGIIGLLATPSILAGGHTDEGFTHTVFCELGVETQSPDSSAADRTLHSLYLSGDYPFYYVTMAADKFDPAKHRLENDYNIYGYPTCFFDGGKQVSYGAESASRYAGMIADAGGRDVPDLSMEVLANWIQCPCQVGLFVETYVTNSGPSNYAGHLSVYIAEINSRWTGSDGIPYHFGFMGYAINEVISVDAYGEHYSSGYWNPPAYGFEDMLERDMRNIIAIAVLFNGTPHDSYAHPPGKNPFTSYYVDSVATDRVFDVDLPPVAKIVSPSEGSLYFFGREIAKIGGETVAIGKISIDAYADDDRGIKKVEFYVDDELKGTDVAYPYSWLWDESAIGRHEVKILAYDTSGNSTSDSMDLIVFNP